MPEDAGSPTLERLLVKLRCPECRQGTINYESCESLRCACCNQSFPINMGLPLLFPKSTLPYFIGLDEERLRNGAPRKRHGGGGAYHWRECHIENLVPPSTQGTEALLLGCGDAGESAYLREMGFETFAFDIKRSHGTDFLADAHCLPLEDETFDLVLSMQVLEHLHSPWLVVQEIARVLKPGGSFVGSVAFLKPYHGSSYFHMTHNGVIHLMESYGLQVNKLGGAQSLTYTIYGNLMPLPRRSLSRSLYGSFDKALGALRAKLWSARTHLDPDAPTDRFDSRLQISFREFEKLRFAPSIVFRARKVIDGERA